MTSAPDAGAEQARGELDALLADAIGYAETLLLADGGFAPYAAALDRGGEVRFVGVGAEVLGQNPRVDDVLAALRGALAAGADGFRATAVVAGVVVDGRDAIRVECEHVGGTTLAVFVPYAVIDGELHYEAPAVDAGPRYVWP